jgi:hypothetical protein
MNHWNESNPPQQFFSCKDDNQDYFARAEKEEVML